MAQLVGLSHAERWDFGSFVVRIRKVQFFFLPFSKFLSLVSFLGLGLVLDLGLGLWLGLGFEPSLTDRS